MEGEREKGRDQNEGSGQQPPIEGAGSAPPRSMGTRGTEFGHPPSDREKSSGQQGQSGTGQADLGSQAGSTLAGHTDQEDLGALGGEVDQPGSSAGGLSGRQAEIEGEGFIARPGSESDEYLQQSGNPESGFAEQGRGASNEGDVERGGERSGERDA